MSLGHGAKKSIVSYGGPPSAIYSLRQLYKYTGPILKIRRSSDSTTQDFFFSNNLYGLPVDNILSFVGGGDGFVETWYDQSGNARHATNATITQQPKIVSNGILETKNTRPTIVFSGTQQLNAPTTLFGSSFGVFQRTSNQMVISQLSSGVYRALFVGSADDAYWTHSDYAYNSNALLNITNTSNPLGVIANTTLYQATGVGTPDSQPIQNKAHSIGFGTPSYAPLDGVISEIVIFNEDIRSTRLYIEQNQMEYYNI